MLNKYYLGVLLKYIHKNNFEILDIDKNYNPLAYCRHLFQPDFEIPELTSLLIHVKQKIFKLKYN